MKISCTLLALFSLCSQLSLEADSTTTTPVVTSSVQTSGISNADVSQLATELLAPFKGQFQFGDLITVTSILDTYFSKNSALSTVQKRAALQSVLEQIESDANFSAPEQLFIENFIPALAFVIFPDSTTPLPAPTDPTPSEQEIVTATGNFVTSINGGVSWETIPACVLFACQFASSYSGLATQEKVFLAQQVLSEIIAKTDNPYLPDIIFDEALTKIGYPLIDYVISGN